MMLLLECFFTFKSSGGLRKMSHSPKAASFSPCFCNSICSLLCLNSQSLSLDDREDGLVSPAPSYGLDWFEGAIASPDRVLQDFIHAVNPSNSTVRPLSPPSLGYSHMLTHNPFCLSLSPITQAVHLLKRRFWKHWKSTICDSGLDFAKDLPFELPSSQRSFSFRFEYD